MSEFVLRIILFIGELITFFFFVFGLICFLAFVVVPPNRHIAAWDRVQHQEGDSNATSEKNGDEGKDFEYSKIVDDVERFEDDKDLADRWDLWVKGERPDELR